MDKLIRSRRLHACFRWWFLLWILYCIVPWYMMDSYAGRTNVTEKNNSNSIMPIIGVFRCCALTLEYVLCCKYHVLLSVPQLVPINSRWTFSIHYIHTYALWITNEIFVSNISARFSCNIMNHMNEPVRCCWYWNGSYMILANFGVIT